MKVCSADDCGGKYYAKGLCQRHYAVAYKISHPEKRAQILASYKAYAAKNKEKRNAYQAFYRASHKQEQSTYNAREESKQAVRAWDKAHPEHKKARQALWRARKRGAEGNHTAAEVKELFVEQKGLCAICRVELGRGYHEDHVAALSRGGSNWIENIQLLCPSCNHRKGAKDNAEFLKSSHLSP